MPDACDDEAWVLSAWAVRHPVDVLAAMWDLVDIPPEDAECILYANATATATVRKVEPAYVYFWQVVGAQARTVAALAGHDIDAAPRLVHAAALVAHDLAKGATS